MTLAEARRGYPGWRSANAPARVAPRNASSRGFRVSYDDVGEGAPIVLVHGFTLSGGDWWETGYVQRLVALSRRVVVVDLLGHGQSDRPRDPVAYRWPDVALDVVAAMDAAGIDRATLWGYSRGAAVAATVAAEAHERVQALILGGAGSLTNEPDPILPAWIKALLGGDWEAYWATPLGSGYSEPDRRYCERVNDPIAFAASLAGRRLYGHADDLKRISVPALVYVGGDDQPDDSRMAAQALGAEFHVLPALDHGGGFSALDEVMALAEPFLGAHEDRRASL